MRVAMIGTRGVPARYGGFETCVEEVGTRLATRGHEVRVYGATNPAYTAAHFAGMERVPTPSVPIRAAETLSRTAMAAIHLIRYPVDYVFAFNLANIDLIRFLSRTGMRMSLHVDGIESQRSKWGKRGQAFYRRCERSAAASDLSLIADAVGIQSYYLQNYNRQTTYIPYGATRVCSRSGSVEALGLSTHKYHLLVARLEPENNVLPAVEAYLRSDCRLPLVIVGDNPYETPYKRRFRNLLARQPRVRWLGSIWDQELLNDLYSSSWTYIHGHSVGGTNPSLLRAHAAGTAVLAYDSVFAREVSGDLALYWNNSSALVRLLEESERAEGERCRIATAGQQMILRRYDWERVTTQFEALAEGGS